MSYGVDASTVAHLAGLVLEPVEVRPYGLNLLPMAATDAPCVVEVVTLHTGRLVSSKVKFRHKPADGTPQFIFCQRQ